MTTPTAVDDQTVAIHRYDSPIGTLEITATRDGVRAIKLPNEVAELGPPPVDSSPHPGRVELAVLEQTIRQLDEYFAGQRRRFDVALDPVGTEFQQSAWSALRTIDFGTTISYGEQARRMGDRRKARAVGAANGRNPIPIIVPCHRVVGADGSLIGFAGGLEAKAWLLAHEGATLPPPDPPG
jgi:methylated-DNA-[protein]-cysteine S-methyltransferase